MYLLLIELNAKFGLYTEFIYCLFMFRRVQVSDSVASYCRAVWVVLYDYILVHLCLLVEYLCVLKPRLQVTSIMQYCTLSHNVLVYVKILCCCGNNCFLCFCFLVFF